MREQYWLDGMMGLIVGDALGLPVQFSRPDDIALRPEGPVTGMEGYGAFHMPAGSWSDDGSMALCALESINRLGRVEPADIAENFVKWMFDGAFTQYGMAYDMGNTCSRAIRHFALFHDPDTCGITGEHANGNGALMRILPVCLYAYARQKADDAYSDEDAIRDVRSVAALTHNHMRSHVACGLYFFMVRAILDYKGEMSLADCLQLGVDQGRLFYEEEPKNLHHIAHYQRLFDLATLRVTPDTELEFSGYVVRAFEAAVWGLLQEDSLEKTLLNIVNHGDDSDTVGAIAGGLAGLYYGYEAIPKDWLAAIRAREYVEDLALDR